MWRSCNGSNTNDTLSLNYMLKLGGIMPRCNQKESWGEQFSELNLIQHLFNCIFQDYNYNRAIGLIDGWDRIASLTTILHSCFNSVTHDLICNKSNYEGSNMGISLILVGSDIKSQRAFFLELGITGDLYIYMFFSPFYFLTISVLVDQKDHGLQSGTKGWTSEFVPYNFCDIRQNS